MADQRDSLEVIAAALSVPIVEKRLDYLSRLGYDRKKEQDAEYRKLANRKRSLLRVIYGS